MLSAFIDKLTDHRHPSSLSSKLRSQRFCLFLKLFQIDEETTILDAGGDSEIWRGSGLEKKVTLLNLTSPKQQDLDCGFTCVQGDALDMHMFGKNQFDVVFSNSVIEHVGSFGRQKRFAEEVQRVGKSYWVQTPNKYFPIEPHILFPFFQFFPLSLQRSIALHWKFSHLKRWNHNRVYILNYVKEIRLLSRKELRSLFPCSVLYREKLFGLTKSLVVYNRGSAEIPAG